jgi:SAM-dependent methyltransferase
MDVVDLRAFYAGPLGQVTCQLLSAALKPLCAFHSGQTVLGMGYALPYLETLVPATCRQFGFMQARQGVIQWPTEGPVKSALVNEFELPLLESAVDHVLVVHGLERTDDPLDMLREIWRVMSPQGRLILVVANRRGLWSASERSPFGFGQPFSRGQLAGLLKEAQFTAITFRHALLMPPAVRPWMIKAAPAVERLGHSGNRFCGVIVAVAIKQAYAFSSGKRARRFVPQLRPVLLPAPRPVPRHGTLQIAGHLPMKAFPSPDD